MFQGSVFSTGAGMQRHISKCDSSFVDSPGRTQTVERKMRPAAALLLVLALGLGSNTAAQWNNQDATSALERRRLVPKC